MYVLEIVFAVAQLLVSATWVSLPYIVCIHKSNTHGGNVETPQSLFGVWNINT